MFKTCKKCKEYKSLSFFGKDKQKLGGYRHRCKSCRRNMKSISDKLYYCLNREKINASQKSYRESNREILIKSKLDYYKNNKHLSLAASRKRKAAKINRTPKWLTNNHIKKIKEIYKIAKDINWLSEEQLQVDHIVPLQGKSVCGLHVPWNLQILPKSFNLSKGNHF